MAHKQECVLVLIITVMQIKTTITHDIPSRLLKAQRENNLWRECYANMDTGDMCELVQTTKGNKFIWQS